MSSRHIPHPTSRTLMPVIWYYSWAPEPRIYLNSDSPRYYIYLPNHENPPSRVQIHLVDLHYLFMAGDNILSMSYGAGIPADTVYGPFIQRKINVILN